MEEALDDMVKSLLVQTDSDDKDRWGLRGHVGVCVGGGGCDGEIEILLGGEM